MNQSGGDSDKLYTILQLEKILYLPKSNLFYNDNTDKYLDSIDSYTLMYLIEKLGLSNVDALNNIFKPSMSGGDDDPELNPDVIPSQPPQEDLNPSTTTRRRRTYSTTTRRCRTYSTTTRRCRTYSTTTRRCRTYSTTTRR